MDTLKLLCRIHMNSARMRQNGPLAPRMPTKHASRIVYISIHHNPAVILRVMFLDFLSGQLVFWRGCFLFDGFDLFGGRGLHPAVCAGARVDGVAEQEVC